MPHCGCHNLCLNHFPAQKLHLHLWDTAVLPWSGCRSSWHYLWLGRFILELFFGSLAGCEELQGREKAWSHLKKLKSSPRNAKSPKRMPIALCKQLSFHLVSPRWFAGLIELQMGQNLPSHSQKLPNNFFLYINFIKKAQLINVFNENLLSIARSKLAWSCTYVQRDHRQIKDFTPHLTFQN